MEHEGEEMEHEGDDDLIRKKFVPTWTPGSQWDLKGYDSLEL